MSITINIYYKGQNGEARRFAEEMVASGHADTTIDFDKKKIFVKPKLFND